MNNFDFEKFFDRSLDMLCISDFNGFFKHINPSFERVLGWSIEDLTTHPFLDFVHPDDVAQTVKEMEKLSTGNVTLSFQNRWRCANGSFR
ncbi:MAG: PAS domain-containing protein, partial [Chloroflexi bacterium]|nr:PAS domain-containing protein [Chloroflexota bacterium]